MQEKNNWTTKFHFKQNNWKDWTQRVSERVYVETMKTSAEIKSTRHKHKNEAFKINTFFPTSNITVIKNRAGAARQHSQEQKKKTFIMNAVTVFRLAELTHNNSPYTQHGQRQKQ